MLQVKDVGSKYGTYILEQGSNPPYSKIPSNQWFNLEEGSTLHFGKLNDWLCCWEDISVLTSAVGSEGRKKITCAVTKMGASLVSAFQENISYLIMDQIMFTQKVKCLFDKNLNRMKIFDLLLHLYFQVLDCLLTEKPIVTVKFLEIWVNALETNPAAPPPDITLYIPHLDPQLVSQFDQQMFLPNRKRNNLFK